MPTLRPLPKNQKDYEAEFRELGAERVRSELLMRRWDAEKRAAARLWVENEDARRWLAGRGDAAPGVKQKWFRKWAVTIAVAFGACYAAVRLFRQMRWGG